MSVSEYTWCVNFVDPLQHHRPSMVLQGIHKMNAPGILWNAQLLTKVVEVLCSYSQAGEGGWFVIFRLFKSILFFVNWISFYFLHFLSNITTLCLLLLHFDIDVIGRLGFFCSCPLCFFPCSRLSSYLFVCLFVIYRFCCSHARVFGKTLVHEFPMSYSHTEWYLPFYARRNSL